MSAHAVCPNPSCAQFEQEVEIASDTCGAGPARCTACGAVLVQSADVSTSEKLDPFGDDA